MKKKTNYSKNNKYVFVLVILIIGFALGYFANSLMQPKPASAREVEQAKNEIAALYKNKAVESCWLVNDRVNLGADKYELTYRNIQINNTVNRAIITDCGESSTLLAKN